MPDGHLLDVNVLLALFDPRHVHHERAHAWFAEISTFATTALTEAAFVRLVSNPHVTAESCATALTTLRTIRAMDNHRFVPDDTSLAEPAISTEPMVGYRQVTDFHLVNLAASRALTFATFDATLHRALAEADRHHVEVIAV
jgi:toxin-antitoxin system PIN domain toxin